MSEKFYVCTAIPYVNDKPHVGHAMDLLYADALKRYHQEYDKNSQITFASGTDEHGVKIADKAKTLGLTPQQMVDGNVTIWKAFFKQLNISNDRFVRTTDKNHEARAAIIWKNLEKDIYKGQYNGWYCVGCEEYKTETEVKETNNNCPNHNRPYDQFKEENYFFKLSAYTDRVLSAIESDEMKVVPSSKKTEIINVLKSGLEDISISRPKEKLSWGINVPGDDTQVMYVWFEALMNYITVVGYPDHSDFKTFWPADVQVIGKDILRFHAAIWPAMLMGLGIDLPKTLLVHGFVTSGGQKMGKSLGNSIDPVELMNEFGTDAYRYYFYRHIPSNDDGDYTPDRFLNAYNNELANELGNAVSRVASMITKYLDGKIDFDSRDKQDQTAYHEAFADFRFDRALDEVWTQVRGLNQYIDIQKPWEIAKIDDEKRLGEVLSYCASNLIVIAQLLVPFMPETAQKIKSVFETGKIVDLDSPLFPKKETKDN